MATAMPTGLAPHDSSSSGLNIFTSMGDALDLSFCDEGKYHKEASYTAPMAFSPHIVSIAVATISPTCLSVHFFQLLPGHNYRCAKSPQSRTDCRGRHGPIHQGLLQTIL